MKKLTPREVKKVFRKKTHCGRYWGVKPRYNFFTKKVSIYMEENEKLIYDMKTGVGKRKDLDYDGCSIPVDFDFKIGTSKEDGELTILRIN